MNLTQNAERQRDPQYDSQFLTMTVSYQAAFSMSRINIKFN